jgi:hypothetical protein
MFVQCHRQPAGQPAVAQSSLQITGELEAVVLAGQLDGSFDVADVR